METCLFTGHELDPDTRWEHTIPASLGGVIRSRRVSCNEVNQAASPLEDKLQAHYRWLRVTLGPLLRPAARPDNTFGQLEDGGRIRIGRDGVAQAAEVYQELPDGRILTHSPNEARRIQQRRGGPPLTSVTFPGRGVPEVIWPEPEIEHSVDVEVAALKGIMLTIDEMLAASGHPRFTRDESLAPVCRYLRDALLNGDQGEHGTYAFGYQTHKLPAITEALRAASNAQLSSFAHSIIASANPATRSLMAVWLVFDAQPIGFCLSQDWRRESFTCVVTCDVLKGSQGGRIHWENRSRDIAGATNLGAIWHRARGGSPADGITISAIDHEYALREKCRQATRLRECTCADWVLQRLREQADALSAQGEECSASVRDLLVGRLSWFLVGQHTVAERSDVLRAIDKSLCEWKEIPACRLRDDTALADSAFVAYAEEFNRLVRQYGLPEGNYGSQFIIEDGV